MVLQGLWETLEMRAEREFQAIPEKRDLKVTKVSVVNQVSMENLVKMALLVKQVILGSMATMAYRDQEDRKAKTDLTAKKAQLAHPVTTVFTVSTGILARPVTKVQKDHKEKLVSTVMMGQMASKEISAMQVPKVRKAQEASKELTVESN